MSVLDLSAREINGLVISGETSAVEVAEVFLKRIDSLDDEINSFINVTPELALKSAKEIDRKVSEGDVLGPLAGVPIAVKDVLCTRGYPTTCGSRMLMEYVPVYDATVVTRCNQAGMVILGKANMDEFAMGSSTENSYFGPTRNPWDTTRVPGGSSGGPAAAVAARESPIALGSDTGGSIRQPASLCGIVGMKPTYGLVSRYGLVAFASSLDQVGPMARDVADCALLLSVIAGHDVCDSTSLDVEIPDYPGSLEGDIRGLRVGVIQELSSDGVESGVEVEFRRAIEKFEELGAQCEEVSLPHLPYALPAYYIIAPAEASSNLARFDGVRYGYRSPEADDVWEMYERTRAEGFGSEVKRRIMLGTYALSSGYYDAYYGQAQKVRTLIVNDFRNAWESFDILVSPTSPTTAFKLGEKVQDPLQMYLSDICTIPVNLAGLPAISLPCGLDKQGLPVGVQLIAEPLAEAKLLTAAFALESALDFNAEPGLGGSHGA